SSALMPSSRQTRQSTCSKRWSGPWPARSAPAIAPCCTTRSPTCSWISGSPTAPRANAPRRRVSVVSSSGRSAQLDAVGVRGDGAAHRFVLLERHPGDRLRNPLLEAIDRVGELGLVFRLGHLPFEDGDGATHDWIARPREGDSRLLLRAEVSQPAR